MLRGLFTFFQVTVWQSVVMLVFAIDIDTLLRLVSVSIIYLYLFAPSKYRHLYVDLSGFIEYSQKNHYLCLANLMLSITCNAIPLEIIMRIEKFFVASLLLLNFKAIQSIMIIMCVSIK